ncbi:MAG: conjugative relaxase [Planctomycetota bacterium]|nr:MAG: conjugative relaxase [Planctomycetota bacterium]
MLSIARIKPGNEKYYLDLGEEDYYLHGGEPKGVWMGSGAKILGLEGTVEDEQFKRLMLGYSPTGKRTKLVQNAGSKNRTGSWDFTVSAPKGVGIAWAIADDEIRNQIRHAHDTAVQKVLDVFETRLAFCRTGKAGSEDKVSARVIAAAFNHSTTRALDCLLHEHLHILNVGIGPDGVTRALDSYSGMYKAKMFLGAVYRAELAHGLVSGSGFELEKLNQWAFDIKGISEDVKAEFSTRRKEIEAVLREAVKQGKLVTETASAAAWVAQATKQPKDIVPPRDELFQQWAERAAAAGLTAKDIDKLINRATVPTNKNKLLDAATQEALDLLTYNRSHFNHWDFLEALLNAPSALGLSVDDILAHGDTVLARGPELVKLGERNGIRHHTTPSMLKMERKLIATIDSLKTKKWNPLSIKAVSKVINKKRDFSKPKNYKDAGKRKIPIVEAGKTARKIARRITKGKPELHTLSPEQAEAVSHIGLNPGRIKVIHGHPGVGKTQTAEAIAELLKDAGYDVQGVALGGNAARELTEKAGIPSNTIRMRDIQMNPSAMYRVKHIWKEAWRDFTTKRRSMFRKYTYPLEKLKIGPKTALIIDECSMIGTEDMLKMLENVDKHGGLVICLGDRNQLSAISAGNPWAAILKNVEPVSIEQIIRQEDPADREAVKLLAEGKSLDVLNHYADKKQLHTLDTPEGVYESVMKSWIAHDASANPKNDIIATDLNQEIDDYNDMAQAIRLKDGNVDESQSITLKRTKKDHPWSTLKKETFYAGDQIIFRERNQKLEIENGMMADIVAIKKLPLYHRVSVKIHGEDEVRVLKVNDVNFRRAYAITINGLQGATSKNVEAPMTGRMLNLNRAHVQCSRHKKDLNIHTTKELAGEALAARAEGKKPEQRTSIYGAPIKDKRQEATRSPLAELMAKRDDKDLAIDKLEELKAAETPPKLPDVDAEAKLQTFADNGLVSVSNSDDELADNLITNWMETGGLSHPEDSLVFTSYEQQLKELNDRIQQERLAAGKLDDSNTLEIDGTTYHAGDLIQITKTPRNSPIRKDTLATIETVSERKVVVTPLDSGESFELPVRQAGFSLAYALPSKELTKRRPENAHVCLSRLFTTQQITYVYHSKHRSKLQLYTAKPHAGVELEQKHDEKRQPRILKPNIDHNIKPTHAKKPKQSL